jgi:hypothetical protein
LLCRSSFVHTRNIFKKKCSGVNEVQHFCSSCLTPVAHTHTHTHTHSSLVFLITESIILELLENMLPQKINSALSHFRDRLFVVAPCCMLAFPTLTFFLLLLSFGSTETRKSFYPLAIKMHHHHHGTFIRHAAAAMSTPASPLTASPTSYFPGAAAAGRSRNDATTTAISNPALLSSPTSPTSVFTFNDRANSAASSSVAGTTPVRASASQLFVRPSKMIARRFAAQHQHLSNVADCVKLVEEVMCCLAVVVFSSSFL